jgi:peroxiredoxin
MNEFHVPERITMKTKRNIQRNSRLKSAKQGRLARAPSKRATSGVLGPRTRAPNFELPATPDQRVSLHDLRGRPTVLVFYPADWSPVCGDQLALYNEILPELKRHDAQVVGISVDGVWCHAAYAQSRKLHFPLLSDFEPKGAVAREYGVYRTSDGICERALFVLDGDGVIRWSYVSPVGVNPGADGILKALEALGAEEEARA